MPAERAPWLLLGVGLLSWFGGELYYTVHLAEMAEPPYPSLSDALYLACYPASYVALMLLMRRRVKEFPVSHWVDGAVAALAVAAFGSAILIGPVMESTGGDLLPVLTDLAYPLADVLLLALVIGTFALSGWRPGRSWSMIGVALVGVALADGVFLYQAASGTYVEGSLLDAAWPAATLLLGFAAWVKPEPVVSQRLEGWRTLFIPSAFALGALGLLLMSEFSQLNRVSVVFAGATLVAAIVRMGLTFGENMKVLARSRSQAMTDALTGLGNRRSLMEDLQDELAVADAPLPHHPGRARPGWVQALQRHLRAPRGRLPARAPRPQPQGDHRAGRHGLPARRRRVLRADPRFRRRGRGARGRDVARAGRRRRGLLDHRLTGRGGPARSRPRPPSGRCSSPTSACTTRRPGGPAPWPASRRATP